MSKSSSPPRRPPASGPKTARLRELNPKRRGELSELAFVYKAASLGFGVAKPYGDSERFDLILISRGWPEGEKLWRVQVKSTAALVNGLYRIKAGHRAGKGRVVPYLPGEIDFLIAHIVPEDSWFVFPIQDVLNRSALWVRPRGFRRSHKNHPRFNANDQYREAWHRAQPPKSRPLTVTPSVTPNVNMTPAVTENSHYSGPVIAAVHPGEHLAKELKDHAMSATELARKIGVPTNRVTQILHGTRAITAETALRLAHFFGTSPQLWLYKQSLYDLGQAEKKSGKSINALPTLKRDEPRRIS